MKKFILVLIISILSSTAYGQLYEWVDENGVKHFSNTPPMSKKIIEKTQKHKEIKYDTIKDAEREARDKASRQEALKKRKMEAERQRRVEIAKKKAEEEAEEQARIRRIEKLATETAMQNKELRNQLSEIESQSAKQIRLQRKTNNAVRRAKKEAKAAKEEVQTLKKQLSE